MPAAIARRSPFSPRRAASMIAFSRPSVALSLRGSYGKLMNIRVSVSKNFKNKKLKGVLAINKKIVRDTSAAFDRKRKALPGGLKLEGEILIG